MVYRLLEYLLGNLLYRWAKKMPRCAECRKVMQKERHPLLFLIPVFYGDDYAESPAYYEKNCRPIHHEHEIPTGQRACRFWTLHCPECGKQKILVEDFLKVRDTEAMEKRCLYDGADIDLTHMSRF